MLDEYTVGIRFEILKETRLFVHNIIARLIFGLVAAILTLLLVVLQYGYPGAGLARIFMTMIQFVIAWYIIRIGMCMMLVLVLMLGVARQGEQQREEDLQRMGWAVRKYIIGEYSLRSN